MDEPQPGDDLKDPVPVGGGLSPAGAGLLEWELSREGIPCRTRLGEGVDRRQWIEVAAADLARARAVRDRVFPAKSEAPAPPRRAKVRRARNAMLVVLLVLGGGARLVRVFHSGALAVAATLLLAGFLGGATFVSSGTEAVAESESEDPK